MEVSDALKELKMPIGILAQLAQESQQALESQLAQLAPESQMAQEEQEASGILRVPQMLMATAKP
jgi:hypothetical protein